MLSAKPLLTVRLATDASLIAQERVVKVYYMFKGKEHNDCFIVLDLDDKFDVILGLQCLIPSEPWVSL